jgi:hypothetical protein
LQSRTGVLENHEKLNSLGKKIKTILTDALWSKAT